MIVRSGFIVALVIAGGGCSGEITAIQGDAGAADGATQEPSLAFTAPANGSTFARESLSALGALVAQVDVAVTADGVERVELYAGDTLLGEALETTVELGEDGPVTLRAIGYDADGSAVADAEISIAASAPQAADCYAWLDLYQLDYTLGPDRAGVDQSVTVATPINGISYRYFYNDGPRESFAMHCELAHSLARAAPHLHARDVVEVLDIGVYNYRCIGGGEPPDCPNGISQHAYAKAIDIAGFRTADDTYYSVNDDWVIDDDGEATCQAETDTDKDGWLHDVICALKGDGVWNIVLTPNYNDGHRDHFHVDLKTGADYIRRISIFEPKPDVIPVVDAGLVCGTR